MNLNQQVEEKVAASNYTTYFESEHHRYCRCISGYLYSNWCHHLTLVCSYIMEGPIMKARHNNFHDVSER